MSTSSSPSASRQSRLYDLDFNPPYQINYRAKRAGKHISATKRRITFQFGFSSARAIAAGCTEVECRGDEHEVVLIWSHLSGKRQLYMDGREIHMSVGAGGNTHFEYSWGIYGGHIMKIIANGVPAMGQTAQCQRQFDLELDGMSFFDFSKIYELGHGVNGGRRHSTASMKNELPAIGYSYRGTSPALRHDEEEEYDGAIIQQQPSLEQEAEVGNFYAEQSPPQSPRMQEVEVNLLDEHQTPPMQEVLMDIYDTPQPAQEVTIDLFDMQLSPTLVSPMTQYSSMPSLVGSAMSTSSSASYDEFTPVECTNNQPSYNAISNEILCAYRDPAPSTAPVSASLSLSRALVPVSEEGMDVVAKSLKNLVNLDDITAAPAKHLSNKAPVTSPDTKQNKQTVPSWALVGRTPTLAEIRYHHANSTQSPNRRSDVMRSQPTLQQQQYQQYHQSHPQAFGLYHNAAVGTAAAQSYGFQYGAQAPNMQYSQAY